jgi:alanine racemase
MQKIFRPTVANISRENFRHNLRVMRELSGHSHFFCPMMKANAYGHGDVELSRVAVEERVSAIGVSLVEEGMRLRENKISLKTDILVFHPQLDEETAEAMAEYGLTPVLSSWPSLKAIEAVAKNKKIKTHLKFDTGMNRLGFSVEDAPRLADYFKSQKKIVLDGLCSHLLAGEDWGAEASRTKEQTQLLKKVAKYFSGIQLNIHLLNSVALLAMHGHKDKVEFGSRAGIALYGIKQEIESKNKKVRERWNEIELKPVMQLLSKIVFVQELKKGETVSYGGRFRATHDMAVAVVPIGYADGYSRHFSNKGRMLCRGHEVNVLGTVCMDFTVIDISELVESNTEKNRNKLLGEEVVIIGRQKTKTIGAEWLAEMLETNSYEVFTNVGQRVPRVYHD